MKKISLLLIVLFVSIFVKAQNQRTGNHNVDQFENSVSSNLNIKLSVYPNPCRSHVNIAFNSEGSTKYTLSIVDMIGRVMITENLIANEGANQKQLELDNFVKGLYMVVIHSDGKTDQATRLIVE